MVTVGSSLQADSQPKSVGLTWRLVAICADSAFVEWTEWCHHYQHCRRHFQGLSLLRHIPSCRLFLITSWHVLEMAQLNVTFVSTVCQLFNNILEKHTVSNVLWKFSFLIYCFITTVIDCPEKYNAVKCSTSIPSIWSLHTQYAVMVFGSDMELTVLGDTEFSGHISPDEFTTHNQEITV